MRTLGIVQARMGSTRLPGKVLRQLAGRSVLGRVVRAAFDSASVDELVVATTTEPEEDAVVAECERLGVAWHRGEVEDVLARFLGALKRWPADAVMRFTADCPLLDPALVALTARAFHATDCDYLSTSIVRMLPRGLDVELISADALRELDLLATGYHRTHVTSYAYTHADEFRVVGLTLPPDRHHLRMTLDAPQDWQVMEAVIAAFGDTTIPVAALVSWLEEHPEVSQLNAEVKQKALADK